MIEIGRVCVKLAGRDAGKKCVIIDNTDNNFVLIDGETRRRKCNVSHLEPLNKTVKISKNASHSDVVKVFKDMGIELKEKKPKKASEKPKSSRSSTKSASEKPKKQSSSKSKKTEKSSSKKKEKEEGSTTKAKDVSAKKSGKNSK